MLAGGSVIRLSERYEVRCWIYRGASLPEGARGVGGTAGCWYEPALVGFHCVPLNACRCFGLYHCFSAAQSSPTLCDPIDCSMPGLPVPYHLPEFAQVHVHCTGDAIQPSNPLTPSSPSASQPSGTFPMSWLFASGCRSIGASASVLPLGIQGWFSLRLTGLISSLSKWLSGVFSSTTVRRHQFFGALPFLCSSSHNCTWPLGRP